MSTVPRREALVMAYYKVVISRHVGFAHDDGNHHVMHFAPASSMTRISNGPLGQVCPSNPSSLCHCTALACLVNVVVALPCTRGLYPSWILRRGPPVHKNVRPAASQQSSDRKVLKQALEFCFQPHRHLRDITSS